eukprot:jgi/Mesvir1/7034/Mv09158-RA.2
MRVPDKDGRLPLHLASMAGNLPAVSFLMRKAASEASPATTPQPDICCVQDKNGDTPCHLAASKGHLAVVEQLLAQGSTAWQRENQAGLTPALAARDKGHADVEAFVVQRGAFSDSPTRGNSPRLYEEAGRAARPRSPNTANVAVHGAGSLLELRRARQGLQAKPLAVMVNNFTEDGGEGVEPWQAQGHMQPQYAQGQGQGHGQGYAQGQGQGQGFGPSRSQRQRSEGMAWDCNEERGQTADGRTRRQVSSPSMLPRSESGGLQPYPQPLLSPPSFGSRMSAPSAGPVASPLILSPGMGPAPGMPERNISPSRPLAPLPPSPNAAATMSASVPGTLPPIPSPRGRGGPPGNGRTSVEMTGGGLLADGVSPRPYSRGGYGPAPMYGYAGGAAGGYAPSGSFNGRDGYPVGGSFNSRDGYVAGSGLNGRDGYAAGGSFNSRDGYPAGGSFNGRENYPPGSSFNGRDGYGAGASFNGREGAAVSGWARDDDDDIMDYALPSRPTATVTCTRCHCELSVAQDGTLLSPPTASPAHRQPHHLFLLGEADLRPSTPGGSGAAPTGTGSPVAAPRGGTPRADNGGMPPLSRGGMASGSRGSGGLGPEPSGSWDSNGAPGCGPGYDGPGYGQGEWNRPPQSPGGRGAVLTPTRSGKQPEGHPHRCKDMGQHGPLNPLSPTGGDPYARRGITSDVGMDRDGSGGGPTSRKNYSAQVSSPHAGRRPSFHENDSCAAGGGVCSPGGYPPQNGTVPLRHPSPIRVRELPPSASPRGGASNRGTPVAGGGSGGGARMLSPSAKPLGMAGSPLLAQRSVENTGFSWRGEEGSDGSNEIQGPLSNSSLILDNKELLAQLWADAHLAIRKVLREECREEVS